MRNDDALPHRERVDDVVRELVFAAHQVGRGHVVCRKQTVAVADIAAPEPTIVSDT